MGRPVRVDYAKDKILSLGGGGGGEDRGGRGGGAGRGGRGGYGGSPGMCSGVHGAAKSFCCSILYHSTSGIVRCVPIAATVTTVPYYITRTSIIVRYILIAATEITVPYYIIVPVVSYGVF